MSEKEEPQEASVSSADEAPETQTETRFSSEPVLLQGLRVIEQNFYLVFTLAFLVWMFFVDGNDFVNQYRNYRQIQELEAQRDFYRARIQEIEAQQQALRTDPEQLEKYAREVYHLQKRNEEVFIIEE